MLLHALFARRPAVFTVHEREHPSGTPLERAERLEFVKDGFSWIAALVPPVWLFMRRQWLALIAYLVASTAILMLVGATEGGPLVFMIFALNALVGFEAPDILRSSLARSGWREIATVSGASREEAERRFFDSWLPAQPATLARPSDLPVRPNPVMRMATGKSTAARPVGPTQQLRALFGSKS